MSFLNIPALKEQQRTELPNGWIVYHKSGELHNETGPAVISPNHQEWYQNGLLHRDDGAARIFINAPDGGKWTCEWFVNGKYTYQVQDDQNVFKQHWKEAK